MERVRGEPLLRLERELEAVEEVGVVERVGDRLGGLRVLRGERLLPQRDHLRDLARRVRAREEGGLGRAPRRHEELHARVDVAAEELADERDVKLPFLLRALHLKQPSHHL